MRLRAGALATILTALTAAPASADLTAFLGANTVPVNRPVRGVAIGVGMLVAFEFEYAENNENIEEAAPAVRTGSANALLQPPFAISGVQPYLTAGVGLFRERISEDNENGFVLNTGGGLKIGLLGPLRLRLDYRMFNMRGARHTPTHRVYAGMNLRF
jgi:opacity protein-like surface antigen